MNRAAAHQLVRELEAAANAHDTDRLMRIYADDAVLVSPIWGELRGRDTIAKTWNRTFALFPDWQVRIDDFLVDGERIAFLGTAGGTDRNGWFGQLPTGDWLDYRAVISLNIRAEKIVRDERIYDLTSLLQRLEKLRIDKELSMAAEVQRALLSSDIHAIDFCEAVGDSIPCRTIGGDFFELGRHRSGSLSVALGDVAGKGPASALLASMIQGMLAVQAGTESPPAEILSAINRLLVKRRVEPRFATLVCGVLSPDGEFAYANGGHNPPILLSGSRIERLTVGGPVIGAFEAVRYEQETIRLNAGDSLVLFSDGVVEARNPEDEEYGEDRLIASLRTLLTHGASELLRDTLESVRAFSSGASQTDDITAVVITYTG